MDEPQKHYARGKKPNVKDHTYCVIPFLLNVQNKQICRDRKFISACHGLEVGRGSDCKLAQGIFFHVMEIELWQQLHNFAYLLKIIGLCISSG